MYKVVLIVFANLFIAFSCTTQKEDVIVLGEFGAIQGQVNGLEKEPLQNVSVSVYDDLDLIKTVKTNKNGEFTVDSLVPKTYTVEVFKNNYAYHINRNVLIEKGEITKLKSIQLSEPIEEVDLKPVIYIYPEESTEVIVQLEYDGELTHSYPKYPVAGWKVTAEPNGTLWDENGKEYYALFWEGKPSTVTQPKEGFVIAGNQTVEFLEESLATLGLNRREANEFIMYWMPLMENNAYNFIHFSSDEYTERATLNIVPEPETMIRVMMQTKPLEYRIDVPLQDIRSLAKKRTGYTVVEWGGSVLDTDVDL